jgi:hypothetical protein
MLEKSLLETDPEIAEIMVGIYDSWIVVTISYVSARNWRSNVKENPSSSLPPRMLPPAPCSMHWDRLCRTSILRDTQEQGTMVATNTSTQLSWLAKHVLWRPFIWTPRNGALMFNAWAVPLQICRSIKLLWDLMTDLWVSICHTVVIWATVTKPLSESEQIVS